MNPKEGVSSTLFSTVNILRKYSVEGVLMLSFNTDLIHYGSGKRVSML